MVGLGQHWTPKRLGTGYRRPAVIISANSFNATALKTVIVAFLTTAAQRAADPGNIRLPARSTGLPKDSILNVTQIASIDRRTLTEPAGRISDALMWEVDAGLRLVLAL